MRVIDVLSMASGEDSDNEQSFEPMAALLHPDERAATLLASVIEQIRNTGQAYRLREPVLPVRERKGSA